MFEWCLCSKTQQSVKIDRSSGSGGLSKQRYLGDYKRRCYGGGGATIAGDGTDDPESSGMAS